MGSIISQKHVSLVYFILYRTLRSSLQNLGCTREHFCYIFVYNRHIFEQLASAINVLLVSLGSVLQAYRYWCTLKKFILLQRRYYYKLKTRNWHFMYLEYFMKIFFTVSWLIGEIKGRSSAHHSATPLTAASALLERFPVDWGGWINTCLF